MPRRKPSPEKLAQQKIKETLDSIVEDDDFSLESVGTEDLPKLKSAEVMDFTEEKQKVGSEAKALLDKMVDYYLDANMLDEAEHLEYKKKIDAMNISSMLLQLKNAQHILIKLTEEIDLGRVEPRLIEVLAQLQGQIMQMPKDYQAYLEKMEESYKRHKEDAEQRRLTSGVRMSTDGEKLESVQSTPGNGIRTRGSKGLMENLRDIIGTDIEDVTDDDIEENAMVNARDKVKMDTERKLDERAEDEEEGEIDPDIDEELFNS